MAAAAHFTTRIYGEVFGAEPFQDADGATAFSRVKDYPVAPLVSLPTEGTQFWALPNGYRVSNFYVYSVIEVAPTGLNVHSTKYVTDTSTAALATLAG